MIDSIAPDSLRVPTHWAVLSEWLPDGRFRMPLTPTKMALATAAMLALLMAAAIRSLPGDERIVVERPTIEARADDIKVMPKADREPIRVINLSTESKPVDDAPRTTPAPDNAPASMPPVLLVQDDMATASRHRRHHKTHNNVCTRHGLRKVETHGGRSWRCR
jgi:hypothetical protein